MTTKINRWIDPNSIPAFSNQMNGLTNPAGAAVKGAVSPQIPVTNPVANYTPNPFTANQIAQMPAMLSPALQQAYANKMSNMGAPLSNPSGAKGMTIGGK